MNIKVLILYMALDSTLGSFQLTCPLGYIVRGQAAYTRMKALEDAQESFLLCIVCVADGFRKDNLDVCLPREFFNLAQFNGSKVSGFGTALNGHIYRHQYVCSDIKKRGSGSALFSVANVGHCSGRLCGIAYNSTNGSISELANLGQVMPCQRSCILPDFKSLNEVWCPSALLLSGIIHLYDYKKGTNPSTCGLCSRPNSSTAEVYVCRRNFARGYKDYNAFYKCLREPCANGFQVQPKGEDMCGFQLFGSRGDEYTTLENLKLVRCNETGADIESLGRELDTLNIVLAVSCAILLAALVTLACIKGVKCFRLKTGGKGIDNELQMQSGEKIITECVENNVYYE